MEETSEAELRNNKPPFSMGRFISSMMVGYFWGQLFQSAIPENIAAGIDWGFLHWLVPLAVALGVWVVGNIGLEKGTPWVAIGAAYLAYFLRFYVYDDSIWFTGMVLSASLAFDTFSKGWGRKPRRKRSFFMRILIITLVGACYLSMWGSYLYFNGTVTDGDGEEIPIHEALHHFFTSPWWTDVKNSFYEVYLYAQHHGWYEIWKQVIELSDPQGENNAYRVLEVSPTASQPQITAQWRKLSKEFHPDKVRDPNQREAAQQHFMDIQQAYEILSKIKSKRKRKNKKSDL